MIRVITYGTYDLLHYGHIRLLERAKALGDYLIVGVTADDFDKSRGKINVQQSLMERIEAVRATGLADKIIVEEYEGQKIDDVRRYDVDIFTVGSDWEGKFDYLKEYCQVVYLPRTEGISSSEVRSHARSIRIGLVGETLLLKKYYTECAWVNGVTVTGVCSKSHEILEYFHKEQTFTTNEYEKLLTCVDAVYIASHPTKHYEQIKKALLKGKHVLCESPVALSEAECTELFALAKQNNLILMDAIKTAYSTAYNRLLLLLKTGKIGRIVSVETTCTSLRDLEVHNQTEYNHIWNSICAWGPTAMLPIFQILGTDTDKIYMNSLFGDENYKFDLFTKADFVFPQSVASFKVGKGVKSEGEMIVSGTKGYVYVPAPWWKTDYFELRYENQENNQRYFYQLDGEGIRYEIATWIKAIERMKNIAYIEEEISVKICSVIEDFIRLNRVKVL